MPTILTQVPGVADRDDSSFGTWVEDDRPSIPLGYFKEVGREGEALGQSPSFEGVTVDSEAPPDLRGSWLLGGFHLLHVCFVWWSSIVHRYTLYPPRYLRYG